MLTPTNFFHLSPREAGLLTVAAGVVGLVIGKLLAVWTNRLCDSPARPREAISISVATAILFAASVFFIVGLEGQRVTEVKPDDFWRYGRLASHLILVSLLIAATATDLREYIIPDQITYFGTLVGVVLATASGDTQLIHFWVDWNHPFAHVIGQDIPKWIGQHPHWHGLVWSLAGACAGAGITWLARAISSLVLGQEAMGLGDVTLMAMIGSFLGWQPMLLVFAFAPFCGIVVGVTVKSILNRPYVPYGPYLGAAALVVMLCWKWIWQWEPTATVSIRRLFGDLPSLGILTGTSLVLLVALLAAVRWWRVGPMPEARSQEREHNNFPNSTGR